MPLVSRYSSRWLYIKPLIECRRNAPKMALFTTVSQSGGGISSEVTASLRSRVPPRPTDEIKSEGQGVPPAVRPPVSHYGLVACCLLAPPDRPTTGRPDRSRSHIHTLRFSLQSGRKCAEGRRSREWVGCASAERGITKPTLWSQCQWRAGNTLRRPWRKKLHLEIRIKVAEAASPFDRGISSH